MSAMNTGSSENKLIHCIGTGLTKRLDDRIPVSKSWKVEQPNSRQTNKKYCLSSEIGNMRQVLDVTSELLIQKNSAAAEPHSHAEEQCYSLDVMKNDELNLRILQISPPRGLIRSSRKKLLILDLNGLLADIRDVRNIGKPYKKVGSKSVFKRPFVDSFLDFCFERFAVGIWSSRKKENVWKVVDYVLEDLKYGLEFCWDLSKCTATKFGVLGNYRKPMVLKMLKKLWDNDEAGLPWKKGDYSPSNTLLLDDSPYKALLNPPHTAIFPESYNFTNEDDNFLAPGGPLRVYLEGLSMADDVQQYVREHPFGQPAITETSSSWDFYLDVIRNIGACPVLQTR